MIRTARPEEFEAVGEVTVRAFLDGGHLSAASEYRQTLLDVAARAAEAEVLVSVEGDKVLGTVTVADGGTAYADIAAPGELEFRMLAVAPEAAGKGVGTALVRAVIARARTLGRERVVLSSQQSMTIAHGLYRRFGFERTPKRDWEPVPHLRLVTFGLELIDRARPA
ncbi:GNAT family N-acetyltransferase [Saccharopolyspora taberi]|uniref:GNAT family N-acetyltransferase n=1 Tax=Saccharopolyspora taberi TaxID=60895 RepID=A0ABN3V5F7_9PSEU